ncbi:hypothetical protein [Actinacidiphila bryophytorum]|uniref:Uncharacterized protein n=1 Tax=Actinacidiphila bryophytorum TaxID=1436133 RepID=A0A9W4H3V1_9ACTN|nr:hypothetical protein [Actinacidiphila bryophytorum]MBM9435897.1 hypothetical protein [Actinacidiphila bryophytorum]MBN6544134.1 hypothetical protein [Actinacidiphila bryophytorum]CAG7649666.1 conserved hypothetical protein [Actinacidiphila bryophytorum]
MDPMRDPQVREWTEATGHRADYIDFLSQSTGIAEWIALSRVFLPAFVEVEGCVLWDRSYDPENFETWRSALNGDVTAIEATLNQLKLYLYVDVDDDATSRANGLSLAEDIATTWRFRLAADFPGRSFSVQAMDTEDGPIVSFVSKRPGGAVS